MTRARRAARVQHEAHDKTDAAQPRKFEAAQEVTENNVMATGDSDSAAPARLKLDASTSNEPADLQVLDDRTYETLEAQRSALDSENDIQSSTAPGDGSVNASILPDSLHAMYPQARNAILQRLARYNSIEQMSRSEFLPEGLKDHIESTQTMLDRTIRYGEGNNMVIWGPPGSGKSMVVDAALASLTSQEADKIIKTEDFTLIKLNGVVHSTDRAALRDIARQLDPSVFVAMNKAETEDEQGIDGDGADLFAPMAITSTSGTWGSFAETFEKILRLLSVKDDQMIAGASLKPIIFILDNIELFAEHPRQSLLYTLFDLAQTGGGQIAEPTDLLEDTDNYSTRKKTRIPVAVIGMTCRTDFLDLLEKRVKSRFSHRIMKILPLEPGDDLEMIIGQTKITSADLCAKGEGAERQRALEAYCQEFNTALRVFWQSRYTEQLMREVFDINNNAARLATFLRVFFATCRPSELNFARLTRIAQPVVATRVLQIKALPWPSLLLTIAIKHLILRGFEIFNLEMIYAEYLLFAESSTASKTSAQGMGLEDSPAKRAKITSMKALPRQTALMAFEQLLLSELILLADTASLETSNAPLAQFPVIGGNTKQDPEYRMCKALFEPLDVQKAVDQLGAPSAIKNWSKEFAVAK